MKKLVAGMLVVALMLTVGSAFAESIAFFKWDPETNTKNDIVVLSELHERTENAIDTVLDIVYSIMNTQANTVLYNDAEEIGNAHDYFRIYNGKTNEITDVRVVNDGYQWWLDSFDFDKFSDTLVFYMSWVYDSTPDTVTVSDVAKEVKKTGVTIYAAPDTTSTVLANAVPYYTVLKLGTTSDGTWTKVDYEDTIGWVLTK